MSTAGERTHLDIAQEVRDEPLGNDLEALKAVYRTNRNGSYRSWLLQGRALQAIRKRCSHGELLSTLAALGVQYRDAHDKAQSYALVTELANVQHVAHLTGAQASRLDAIASLPYSSLIPFLRFIGRTDQLLGLLDSGELDDVGRMPRRAVAAVVRRYEASLREGSELAKELREVEEENALLKLELARVADGKIDKHIRGWVVDIAATHDCLTGEINRIRNEYLSILATPVFRRADAAVQQTVRAAFRTAVNGIQAHLSAVVELAAGEGGDDTPPPVMDRAAIEAARMAVINWQGRRSLAGRKAWGDQ